eukprot:1767352-Rhodomonas_salina.3
MLTASSESGDLLPLSSAQAWTGLTMTGTPKPSPTKGGLRPQSNLGFSVFSWYKLWTYATVASYVRE